MIWISVIPLTSAEDGEKSISTPDPILTNPAIDLYAVSGTSASYMSIDTIVVQLPKSPVILLRAYIPVWQT